MKKKCCNCWVVVAVTIMVLLKASLLAAENKVVVIPLASSSAKKMSVNVYDDNGQYLGQFVGNNAEEIEILVPHVGKILAITREGGNIRSSSGYWYYKDSSCADGPYLRMVYSPSGANLGILFSNSEPNCDFFGANPIASQRTMHSRKSQNGYGACEVFFDDAFFSPITQYTDVEVGFSYPLSFPLEFRTE